MRFPWRQFGTFAPRRLASRGQFSSSLSTLLLAALCVLLAAPASQAAAREETGAAILTQVLAASASSSHLSALETRQVRVLLSRLEKSDAQLSLQQIERELACLEAASTPLPVAFPSLHHFLKSQSPDSLSCHAAAQLSGVRTNSYRE